MNQHINALLGPLEAATRSDSWEDAEDIAREISRLARMERLKELQRIQEALVGRQGYVNLKQPSIDPKTPPIGSQVAKTPLPISFYMPFHAGELLEKLKDSDWTAKAKAAGWDAEELRKTALEALPATPPDPIKQGESTPIGFHVEQWPFG